MMRSFFFRYFRLSITAASLFFSSFIVNPAASGAGGGVGSYSYLFPYDLLPEDSLFPAPEGIEILSAKGLKLTDTQGRGVEELSDLAWDEDEKILYAISDEGWLYHLRINMKDADINRVRVIAEYRLQDQQGRVLKKKWRDSEGLSIRYQDNKKQGDTELLIAFEGKPRIARYNTAGKFLGNVQLPDKLLHKKSYRSKNKALESVTVHPEYGVLTAAEYPLKNHPMSLQTIYSTRGQEWHFKASPAQNSAITALETLPNGDLMILERAWAGIQHPAVITLSRLVLGDKTGHRKVEKKELAVMSSATGWLLDNFEGLTHYHDKQYLMVSDDGGNTFQTTVLVLFRVK